MSLIQNPDLPSPQGLYDPVMEHDSCGVNFLADYKDDVVMRLFRQQLQPYANSSTEGLLGQSQIQVMVQEFLFKFPINSFDK